MRRNEFADFNSGNLTSADLANEKIEENKPGVLDDDERMLQDWVASALFRFICPCGFATGMATVHRIRRWRTHLGPQMTMRMCHQSPLYR
jgi:hypothetical protein